MHDATDHRYQLRFRSLREHGADYVFSCDAAGRVDLDLLSARSRNDYFYARAMVGRDLAPPSVELVRFQPSHDGQPRVGRAVGDLQDGAQDMTRELVETLRATGAYLGQRDPSRQMMPA